MLSTIKLCKYFSDRTILSDISFVLTREHRVGLVGPNGCGKSTLLGLLMGEIGPDEGYVQRHQATRLAYVRQNWDIPCELTLSEFLQENEQTRPNVMRVSRTASGSSTIEGDRTVTSLSGGERTRLLLTQALHSDAEILLLDEPTNNLDLESIEWLEQALLRQSAGYLIASHDRKFLDNVTDRTFELDPLTGRLTEYGGGYFSYVQTKQSNEKRQWREYNEQQRRATKLEGDVRAVKDQALANELTSVNDFVRGRAKKVAAKAKAREKRLMRMISDEHRIEKPRTRERMRLDFKGSDLHRKLLFELKDVDLCRDHVMVLQSVQLAVQGNARIALCGANGSGKSTLLSALVGALVPSRGTIYMNESIRVAYMRQDNLDIPEDTSVLDHFTNRLGKTAPRSSKLHERGAARTFLHRFLFTGNQVFTNATALSKGEQGKLQFACFMAAQPDVLIMDEPTNHMDIPAIESLQQALEDYGGALIVVSHDREFLKEIGVDTVWHLANGTVTVQAPECFLLGIG